MAGVPFLAARRFLARFAPRFRFRPEPVRGRRFAGVAAVLRQTIFKIGHPGRQSLHLGAQRLHLREQSPDQIVLIRVAESVKIRQFFHAFPYRLSLPFLIPGVAMLFRPI